MDREVFGVLRLQTPRDQRKFVLGKNIIWAIACVNVGESHEQSRYNNSKKDAGHEIDAVICR